MLSIITSCKNGAGTIHLLAASIQHAINHSCDIQWILKDACSSDNSIEIARSYVPSVLVLRQPDLGIYDAWNYALGFALGTNIVFFGADDFANLDFYREASSYRLSKHEALVFKVLILNRFNLNTTLIRNTSIKGILPVHSISYTHPGVVFSRMLYCSNSFDSRFSIISDSLFYMQQTPINVVAADPSAAVFMLDGGISASRYSSFIQLREFFVAKYFCSYKVRLRLIIYITLKSIMQLFASKNLQVMLLKASSKLKNVSELWFN